MSPYYQDSFTTLYHGDCREVLPLLESPVLPVTFNACVSDPPYGDTSLKWDTMFRGWLDLVEPLTRNVWCFGSFRMFMEMARLGDVPVQTWGHQAKTTRRNALGYLCDELPRLRRPSDSKTNRDHRSVVEIFYPSGRFRFRPILWRRISAGRSQTTGHPCRWN